MIERAVTEAVVNALIHRDYIVPGCEVREVSIMSDNQYSALLAIIVPQIMEYIVQNSNIDDKDPVAAFYRSRLYSELANENLKLWHYSPRTLYAMCQDELLTGSYDYPEDI